VTERSIPKIWIVIMGIMRAGMSRIKADMAAERT